MIPEIIIFQPKTFNIFYKKIQSLKYTSESKDQIFKRAIIIGLFFLRVYNLQILMILKHKFIYQTNFWRRMHRMGPFSKDATPKTIATMVTKIATTT